MGFSSIWVQFAAEKGGYPRISCLKSVAVRMVEHKREQSPRFSQRLKVFLRTLLFLLGLPFRLKRRSKAKLLMLNVDRKAVAYREEYLRDKVPFVTAEEALLAFDNNDPSQAFYYHDMDGRRLLALFGAMGLILRASLSALFSDQRINPQLPLACARNLIQNVLWKGEGRAIISFFNYHVESYLPNLVAPLLVPEGDIYQVAADSILYYNNRYLYNPELKFRLCAPFQNEEVGSYLNLGWYSVKDIDFWGLENGKALDQIPRQAPSYDIGLYSSGEWARFPSGYSGVSMKDLRAYTYTRNRLYVLFEMTYEAILQFKASHPQLKVKLYPHPLERRLWKQDDIPPPYLQRLQEAGVEIDQTEGSSLGKIYECRLGIALQSTILFERMYLGLDSFYYGGMERRMWINPVHLGSYAPFAYRNQKELQEKLVAYFTEKGLLS